MSLVRHNIRFISDRRDWLTPSDGSDGSEGSLLVNLPALLDRSSGAVGRVPRVRVGHTNSDIDAVFCLVHARLAALAHGDDAAQEP